MDRQAIIDGLLAHPDLDVLVIGAGINGIGGIRYLENWEFRLVAEAVNERNRLLVNASHLADAAALNTLKPEHLAVCDAARAAMHSRMKIDCSACRYCQPCLSGVEIPELLAALNAASIWDTKNPWLTGYTRIGGKPAACTECGQCENICPQNLPIHSLLKEDLAAVFGG